MKKKSMLAALVMLSLLHGSVYAKEPCYNQETNAYYANGNDTKIEEGDNYCQVYGNGGMRESAENISDGSVTVTGGSIEQLLGAYCYDAISCNNNKLQVEGGNITTIFVVDGDAESITENSLTIDGGNVNAIQGFANRNSNALIQDNHITINNVTGLSGGFVGMYVKGDNIIENTITINKVNSESPIYFGGMIVLDDNESTIKGNKIYVGNGKYYTIQAMGGYVAEVAENELVINGDAEADIVYGVVGDDVSGNKLEVSGDTKIKQIYAADGNDVSGNELNITDNSIIGKEGEAGEIVGASSENGNVTGNSITLSGNSTVYGEIVGGLSSFTTEGGTGSYEVTDNSITLAGNSTIIGHVYGGSAADDTVKVSGNSITLQGQTDVEQADLYGYKPATTTFSNNVKSSAGDMLSNNNLIIDGWTGTANSVQNFNNINFNNLVWNTDENAAVLTTNSGSLDGTNVSFTLQSGQKVNVGDSRTLISSSADLGAIANAGESLNTTMGLTADVNAVLEQSADNTTVTATIKDIKLNDQTMLVAENRAVAAAFVNQGTDLIADSLDTLSRDGKYGVKTFAAVHGNRSKYDVNSDIKINGWSTIVGVGSETEHNDGDFSWGVFYENGSGNYRTFNSFNNEYFRGDGSLVYNGGGIAARYENAHGVYTEGSLRAGMLKSDMDNALSDGENKYGYSSESEYYGAHIGIGQIIPLSESSDLDVYGKFFHTYTEGDSFKVDTDEFEFDSINSDRLRVGARLTTNKENKFSTYYGLAYEYEFNGDAEMRAAGMNAPTQSLQGSSYMAEVGFNYQPTPESPWSFDLNMRGYAGEREGATFNVQATYTF